MSEQFSHKSWNSKVDVRLIPAQRENEEDGLQMSDNDEG
jgi:hypothetical protein